MKVLLIDVNYKHSSTGKIVHDLYQGLMANGHEAAVCYGRGPLEVGENIYKFGINLETYFHAAITRLSGLTGYFSPISTFRLIRYIKRFNPDVVHIHELHAYFVNYLPIINYLKKNNIRTIWTFHCEFMYTGKCGHANECNNWKVECHDCPQIREYPKSLLFDFTRKMFRDKKRLFTDFSNLVIVTPSQWLADRVKQSFLSDKNIYVIHNGINTENIFFPRDFQHLKEKHQLKDEKIVLAVAPDLMSKQKGGRWVVELAKRFKGQNVKFILIGVKDLREEFDDNIIALGRTDNQVELAEYYSMADVFVICSERENFPTTCLEALSCGTPVLGFDTGGTSETAPKIFLGNFVPFGNIDNLYSCVKQNLEKSYNSEQIVSYCKKYYSTFAMYKRYLNQYSCVDQNT
jgi:glycosyltransferase involved in cell wall biosynthesis